MKIKKIIVDEMPKNCGECCMMHYNDLWEASCFGIIGENSLAGADPYSMSFRRSDCPLQVESDVFDKIERKE